MVSKNELNRAFAEGIERARTQMGVSQKEMARRLDMSLSSYKSMLRGEQVSISIYTLFLACQETGLLASQLTNVPMEEASLLSHFRRLPEHRKQILKTILQMEEELAATDTTQAGQLVPLYTPTGNMEDGMLFDAANAEGFDVSKYVKCCPESIDCGIRITSNHLHPVYHMDDILLIHQAPPRDGDTGIFIHKPTRRVYIRRFKQTSPCRLIPMNGYGKEITVDSYDVNDMNQWIKFGRVMMHI